MAVHTIYGRVLPATSSPHHELLTVVTVRPVCACTRTPSCSIVQKETTWAVNAPGWTSHRHRTECPHGLSRSTTESGLLRCSCILV